MYFIDLSKRFKRSFHCKDRHWYSRERTVQTFWDYLPFHSPHPVKQTTMANLAVCTVRCTASYTKSSKGTDAAITKCWQSSKWCSSQFHAILAPICTQRCANQTMHRTSSIAQRGDTNGIDCKPIWLYIIIRYFTYLVTRDENFIKLSSLQEIHETSLELDERKILRWTWAR
jgi:hypothetical protein